MKTYPLSVKKLMWNLTLERHDNCAPCLGLILPIRWVTPPPNSSFWSVFLMALHLLCLRIWFVFNVNMTSCLSSQWWFGFILIYTYISVLSSTAFTYSYIFSFESFELSECDRTLTYLCSLSQNSISPSHMHSVETCQMSSLSPCQQKTQRQTFKSIFHAISLLP